MRKNYISPEYNYSKISGFNNPGVENSIFINTIPNLPQYIELKNDDIIYYENTQGEQFDSINDYGLPSKLINCSDLKQRYSVLSRVINNNFKLSIDIKNLFLEYVFGLVKRSKMFINLTKNNCINNDVNITIRNYIVKSILPSFNLDQIDFFISYNDIKNTDALLNEYTFDKNLINNKAIENYTSKYDQTNYILEISFNSIKSLDDFNFNYYYNITFQNINR